MTEKIAFIQVAESTKIAGTYAKGVRGDKYMSGIISGDARQAADGLQELGYTVRPFNFKSLMKRGGLKGLTPETPIKGTTGCVAAAYRQLFGSSMPTFDIPDDMKGFARRKVWNSTIGEIRRIRLQYITNLKSGRKTKIKPFFVKPVEAKVFSGAAIDSEHSLRSFFQNDALISVLPDSYPVLMQEVLPMDSEQRFFVHNRKLVVEDDDGSDREEWRRYSSRFASQPCAVQRDYYLPAVQEAIDKWENQPAAYAIDVARIVMDDSGSEEISIPVLPVLVEVNNTLTCASKAFNLTSTQWAQMMIDTWASYCRFAQTGKF